MTPQLLSSILGLLQPFVVELFKALTKNPNLPRWVSFAFSLAVSLLVGFITVYASGKLDLANLLQSSAYGFTIAQTTYNLWFKPSGTDQKVASLVS